MLMRQGGKTAKLHFMANGFRVLVHGDHVTCAVTGVAIPLDQLRYWSVTRQEAYASPEVSTQAALAE